MKRLLLSATAAAFLLTGCADPNAPGRNTVGGALLGAGTGALLGTLAGGNDRRNALVGAGIGLVAGSAIGNYLDRNERALRQDLQGTGATVRNDGQAVTVVLPANVTFDTDSAEINPGFYRPLNRVTQTLNQYPKSFIDIIGHTDSTGSEAYNQDLSERRAQSVAGYFRDSGIFPGRIAAYGVGESEPIATNASPEGRRQNRRVELVIIPAQER